MAAPGYTMKTTLGFLTIALCQAGAAASAATNIHDVYTGPFSADPGTLVTAGGYTYFSAEVPYSGRELVRADRSGFEVMDLRPRRYYGSNPNQLTKVGDTLYFSAGDSKYGVELWKVDAQSGTASVVHDIRPGPGSSRPGNLTSIVTAHPVVATILSTTVKSTLQSANAVLFDYAWQPSIHHQLGKRSPVSSKRLPG